MRFFAVHCIPVKAFLGGPVNERQDSHNESIIDIFIRQTNKTFKAMNVCMHMGSSVPRMCGPPAPLHARSALSY